MSYPTSVEFEKNSDNLKAVKASLKQLERLHKDQIRSSGDWKTPERVSPPVATLRRLQLLSVGILTEATLRKVIVDPTGFNEAERAIIWGKSSQSDRWLSAIELSYRRHFNVPIHIGLDQNSLDAHTSTQLQETNSLVRDSLQPVIEDRNKLAHGQWRWQLKSRKENEFLVESRDLSRFDYCQIKAMTELVTSIGKLIQLLVVSEPTFQRDYSAIQVQLSKHRAVLVDSPYQEFCAGLVRQKSADPLENNAEAEMVEPRPI